VTTAGDLVGSGYLQRVHGMIEQKNHPAAQYWAERGMQMTPYDYRIPRWVARIAAVDGDPVLAERMLAIRLKVHPRLADALSDRAEAYRRAGQRDAAMGFYQDLVRVAPISSQPGVMGWGRSTSSAMNTPRPRTPSDRP